MLSAQYIDRLAKPTPKEEEEQEAHMDKPTAFRSADQVSLQSGSFRTASGSCKEETGQHWLGPLSGKVNSRICGSRAAQDRIMQLANEKRVWHEVRERQRPAPRRGRRLSRVEFRQAREDGRRGAARLQILGRSALLSARGINLRKGFEQAAAQLRDEVARPESTCKWLRLAVFPFQYSSALPQPSRSSGSLG